MNRSNSTVLLHQVPQWSDVEVHPLLPLHSDNDRDEFAIQDPLLSPPRSSSPAMFPVDDDLNSKLYVWPGDPWNLHVDAVVNSCNETLDEMESIPGLHDAAGPKLAEECSALNGCRIGMAQITGAYELSARRIIHTVGPKYVEKYHSAAENALSRCYQSCLEILIENSLESIAVGCIYTESRGYPREQAAHVALRTIRRFLEKHRNKIDAVVLCLQSTKDLEVYERLLLLYFPRNSIEENYAQVSLPADIGDENGESTILERRIRITTIPGFADEADRPNSPIPKGLCSLSSRTHVEGSSMDSSFLFMTEDPDRRREEQWERATKLSVGWTWPKWLGSSNAIGGMGTSFHNRYLARANAVDLSEIRQMKILYHGGVDKEGHSLMVVIGAHFLLRCLDLEHFLLYVVKEFQPLINKPYSIVYFHSAASLQLVTDTKWVKHAHQIMDIKHKTNLCRIYVVHPTLSLKANLLLMRILVDPEVWSKTLYIHRLSDLFRFVSKDQLTIPDFIFQHDKELNGSRSNTV